MNSLREALELWMTGDQRVLRERVTQLSSSHIPPEFLGCAYGLAKMFGTPVALLHHGPSFSAREKKQILERDEAVAAQLGENVLIEPVKTVTLGFKAKIGGRGEQWIYVLVTGIGDFHVDKVTEREIGEVLELPRSVVRGVKINPEQVDPELLVGLKSGVVGPFVRPSCSLSIFPGIFRLRDDFPPETFAAVAVSPWDTLVVRKSVFWISLNWWHEHNAVGTFLKPMEGKTHAGVT